MPYLVAPGWAPRYGIMETPPGGGACQDTGRRIYSGCAQYAIEGGTSASAPTLNGMVLDLFGQKPFLANKPEATRAIILLTSRNVRDGYWNRTFDGVDGNGVVHGQDAISFAQSMATVSPGNGAVANGLWIGSLSQADFNGNSKDFNVKIPSVLPTGKHLRFVLTWDSSPDFIARVDDLSDVDLGHWASDTWSSSFDGNIEILDLPVSITPAGSTQVISVVPYVWRIHPNARSSIIYAAAAWSFVADHAH
jgi:hypothetical protein